MKKYTKKQITEAIAYWENVLESINEDELISIPNSEWDKMLKYIQKGSNFEAVGAACRSNPLKQKCRYLILKSLGLDSAAEKFLSGLYKYISYDQIQALKSLSTDGIVIPVKYQSLNVGKEELLKTYLANNQHFNKSHISGPLKMLTKMGIDYITLYSDGSGKQSDKDKALEIIPEGIPTYKPSYSWVGNSGVRWDIDLIVIMLNGKIKNSDKRYFGYVAHTLESIDSGNPGYSVFSFNNKQYVYVDGDCDNVTECMKWIVEHVEKIN